MIVPYLQFFLPCPRDSSFLRANQSLALSDKRNEFPEIGRLFQNFDLVNLCPLLSATWNEICSTEAETFPEMNSVTASRT